MNDRASRFQRLTSALLAASLVGCATMADIPEPLFLEKRERMTDEGVCAAAFTAAQQWKQAEGSTFRQQLAVAYLSRVEAELARRGRDVPWCVARRKEQQNTAAAVIGIAAVVGVAALAASGGGAARSPSYASPVGPDYDWAWDEFFDESFRLVWACRGVQTGQFADQSRCASKLKADLTWPEKTAPSRP